MMVECPKCGFSQPKDRYCASCGVDMDEYQPQRRPLFATLKPYLILFSLLALIGGLTFYMFQRHGSDGFEFQTRPSRPQQVTPTQAQRKQQPPPAKESNQRRVEPPKSKKSSTELTVKTSAEPTESETTNEQTSPTTRPQSFRVILLEVDQEELSTSAWRLLQETDQYIAYIRPSQEENPQSDLNQLRSAQVISEDTERWGTEQGIAFDWSYEDRNGDPLGLQMFFLSASEGSEDAVLRFQMFLNLPQAPSLPVINLQNQFSIKKGEQLILLGLLPRQPIDSEGLELAPGSPLQLLNQPNFIDGLSEFVVVVQPIY